MRAGGQPWLEAVLPRWSAPPRPRRARLPRTARVAIAGAAGAAVVAASVDVAARSPSILYLLYVGVSLLLAAVAAVTLAWMVNAWRTPSSMADDRWARDDLSPVHSFSLIVPARHEESVLEQTLLRLIGAEHPAFEVVVVVGADDPGTRAVAERVSDHHPGLVKVVVDASWPKSKPRALNAALPHCTGTITAVFDAEDDVHPRLLARVDDYLQRTGADVVQAGVQLMNFGSSWLAVRNVLEYYFWFRSRLRVHARQGFVPLGGNTVFVRTAVLRGVAGWDPDCLAEDCELGVRLSAMGAHMVVFYDPELATREECPPTLRAFVRQRTRWDQGYLQTLSKRFWRRLPIGQRALGAYILASPYLMALVWLLFPVALATAIALKAPVPVTLVSFIPALPMLSILLVEIAGLGEFCRIYGGRPSARDYLRLVVGFPFYQAVLAFAAARAAFRELKGARNWEKTTHFGLHLPTAAPSAPSESVPHGRAPVGVLAAESPIASENGHQARLANGRHATLGNGHHATVATGHHTTLGNGHHATLGNGHHATLGNGHHATLGNGHHPTPPAATEVLGALDSRPLWIRLNGASAAGAVALPPAAGVDGSPRRPRGIDWREFPRLLAQALTAHRDLVLQAVLLAVVGYVVGTNLLHYPAAQFDEGTYTSWAWALQHGRLANYTYSYGHPPLGWIVIFLWTSVAGLFGHGGFSIDTGREFMLFVTLVSCSLVYVLARRLGMGRGFAAAAVILFGLSPLALFYHRPVLLDNPSLAWALAAFVLARTPQRRLWAFAGSGACFAAAVLSKETTLVLFPALLFAVYQHADRRNVRYCLAQCAAFFFVIACAYPLYATLKGELLPGRGHVSLFGYTMVQLFTRKGSGSLFDLHSQTHAFIVNWLGLDPWLLGASVALLPVALARRSTRAVALAFLIQVAMILRPGYLPNMYVIGLLPFAALIVAGAIEALWRRWLALRFSMVAWLVALVVGVPALALAVQAARSWAQGDQLAMTSRPDAPMRAAERWLVAHVPRDKRLIVTDDYWIYLIGHGFDSHPVRGGFYSRTVVSYWPLDYDPAVRRHFPGRWRDFDYVVVNSDMRATMAQTPTAAQAVAHSHVVAAFGRGALEVEVRAIDRHARSGA